MALFTGFFFPFSQYPFELGLMAAFVFSALVCLSRLYTGMHTVLVRMPHAGRCGEAGGATPLHLWPWVQRQL